MTRAEEMAKAVAARWRTTESSAPNTPYRVAIRREPQVLPEGDPIREAWVARFSEGDPNRESLELHVPEADPPRRSGCSIFGWLALLLAIALGIAPQGAIGGRSWSRSVDLRTAHADSTQLPLSLAASGEASVAAIVATAPTPTGSVGTALLGGWISWADPDLGGDYLAARFPRGTLVRICAVECLIRRSNDFGPSAKIDPPRIADLAVLDWEQLCGLPRARGVCRGTVEAIDEIALPATDTGP